MSIVRDKLGIDINIPSHAWDLFIFAGWAGIVLFAAISAAIPASEWMEVRSVHVEDSVAGANPQMQVDRTIKSDFVGNWLVEVERDYGAGFGLFCSARGEAAYRQDAVLPTPLYLDWWTYPVKCILPAGRYRVETTWTISPELVPTKTVRSLSNVFNVTDPVDG